MNVLSLFDGISCGQVALERAGLKVNTYYASEIDEKAISVSKYNFPSIIRLGDITKIDENCLKSLQKIDLVIGGSPCQSFSVAGDGSGFDGKSGLYWEFSRILKWIQIHNNPNVKFLLENVRMKKEWSNVITSDLGVIPTLINSALVSAQSRSRMYWTNIGEIYQPEDKHIYL